MSSTIKDVMFWMIAALVIFLFWSVSSRIQKTEPQLRFSDFVAQVERGHVKRVIITGSNAGNQIDGEFKNGLKFRTFAPPEGGNLVNKMLEKGVEVNARGPNASSWLGHIISWSPIAIMIFFLIVFMRQMRGPRPLSREERRLELKARVFELLSENNEDLPKERISAMLSVPDGKELRTALYHMVREGTVLIDGGKKVPRQDGGVNEREPSLLCALAPSRLCVLPRFWTVRSQALTARPWVLVLSRSSRIPT